MFHNSFLEKCLLLKEAGFWKPPKPCMFFGRGFADLGFEVFTVVPGGKLISLFSGDTIPIDLDFKEHFFVIPSCDDIAQELLKLGVEISSLSFFERREWRLTATKNAIELKATSAKVHELFIDTLAMVIKEEG